MLGYVAQGYGRLAHKFGSGTEMAWMPLSHFKVFMFSLFRLVSLVCSYNNISISNFLDVLEPYVRLADSAIFQQHVISRLSAVISNNAVSEGVKEAIRTRPELVDILPETASQHTRGSSIPSAGYTTPPLARRSMHQETISRIEQWNDSIKSCLEEVLVEEGYDEFLLIKQLLTNLNLLFFSRSFMPSVEEKAETKLTQIVNELFTSIRGIVTPEFETMKLSAKFLNVITMISELQQRNLTAEQQQWHKVETKAFEDKYSSYILGQLEVKALDKEYGTLANIPEAFKFGGISVPSREEIKRMLMRAKKPLARKSKQQRKKIAAATALSPRRFKGYQASPARNSVQRVSPHKGDVPFAQHSETATTSTLQNWTTVLQDQLQHSGCRCPDMTSLLSRLLTAQNPALCLYYCFRSALAEKDYRVLDVASLLESGLFFLSISSHDYNRRPLLNMQLLLGVTKWLDSRLTVISLSDADKFALNYLMLVDISVCFYLDDITIASTKLKFQSSNIKPGTANAIVEKLQTKFSDYLQEYVKHAQVLSAEYLFAHHHAQSVYVLPAALRREYDDLTPAMILAQLNREDLTNEGISLKDYCYRKAVKDARRSLCLEKKKYIYPGVEGDSFEKMQRHLLITLYNFGLKSSELRVLLASFLVQTLINPGECMMYRFMETVARIVFNQYVGHNLFRDFMLVPQEQISADRTLPLSRVVTFVEMLGKFEEDAYYNIEIKDNALSFNTFMGPKLLLLTPSQSECYQVVLDNDTFFTWQQETLIPLENSQLNISVSNPVVWINHYAFEKAKQKYPKAATCLNDTLVALQQAVTLTTSAAFSPEGLDLLAEIQKARPFFKFKQDQSVRELAQFTEA